MKLDDPQLLLKFVRAQQIPIYHLAYTKPFEDLCASFSAASLDEKHEILERLIDIQTKGPSSTTTIPDRQGQQDSSAVERVDPQATPPSTKANVPSEIPTSLFEPPVLAQQPWTFLRKPSIEPEYEEQRQRLLAGIANSDFGTTELRVGYLLQHFPETRNSDVALCIRYWKRFQADILEQWNPLELEILFDLDRWATIERVKREIQGKLQLFRASEEGKKGRDLYQTQLYEYLASHRDTTPEVRFYLDETGNEGNKRYTGVAGVCVMNWRQYEKHFAALEQWRQRQGPETIHFAETGTQQIDRAVNLLAEVSKRRTGLLFAGYAMASRGRTYEDMFSLFVQIVVDSLKCLRESGSLKEPKVLRVVKEAEPGFDEQYLPKMNQQLAELVANEFPGLIVVEPVETLTKGRHAMLECADLIAGGMQRRASYKGRNPKDVLAEAVINVTGFEEPADAGALYKFYP